MEVEALRYAVGNSTVNARYAERLAKRLTEGWQVIAITPVGWDDVGEYSFEVNQVLVTFSRSSPA